MKHRRTTLLVMSAAMALVSEITLAQEKPYEDATGISLSQVEDLTDGATLGAALSKVARPINKATVELVKSFEGWINHPYNDPSSYCTVGYGHLIALLPCENPISASIIEKMNFTGPISLDFGTDLLIKDTVTARLAVSSLTSGIDLNQNQFGALVSFTFNVGKGNLQKSNLLKLIKAQAFDKVPMEFARWTSSKGKIYPGLARRRGCEAALFTGQLQLSAGEKIDTDTCITLGAAPGAAVLDIATGE